jgi:hypothetical protein
MAGSPISQQAQYADDVLTRQILAPQAQFLIDGVTLAAQGSIYFTIPTQGRITKIRALTQTVLGGAANIISLAPLGGLQTVTIANGAAAKVTWAAHNLAIGAPVSFSATGTLNTGLTAGHDYYVSAYNYTAGSFTLSTTAAYALLATAANSTGHVDTSTAGVAPVFATNYVIVPKYGSSAVGDINVYTWADTGLSGGSVYAADAVWVASVYSAGSPTGAIRIEVVVEPTYT